MDISPDALFNSWGRRHKLLTQFLVSPGDLMVVPPRAIHTFENASGTEEAELYMTATPGYYIDCEFCMKPTRGVVSRG